jgi:hypothetical protein
MLWETFPSRVFVLVWFGVHVSNPAVAYLFTITKEFTIHFLIPAQKNFFAALESTIPILFPLGHDSVSRKKET